MANYPLHPEFLTKQRRIALGNRALVAMAAHLEVRSVLKADPGLRAHGLDDVLIGSYARKVAMWPGKDVDVFGRLMGESIESILPDTAYGLFGTALQPFDDQGRLTPQTRSFKVDYGPRRTPDPTFVRTAAKEYDWDSSRVREVLGKLDETTFEFSVDVVPAVVWGDHYGIPDTGRDERTGSRYRTGNWRLTSPVRLTELTQARNGELRIRGVGAYGRTVRATKQIKSHWLHKAKPSALYYEFILHEGFSNRSIRGDCWADVTASALTYIVDRLGSVATDPVCDPVLGERYNPAPSQEDVARALSVFEELARKARRAVSTEVRCQAGVEWRYIFGANAKYHPHVFPLPDGCRGTGAAMGAAAANVSTGGTEERSFGGF